MEPMNLSGPHSPGATNAYLPAYLMGETEEPANQRLNTMSPHMAARTSFAPSGSTSYDSNNSTFGQKNVFGGNCFPQTPPAPLQNSTGVLSGPPIKGLFDTLQDDENALPLQQKSRVSSTPLRAQMFGSSVTAQTALNLMHGQQCNKNYNDTYLNKLNTSNATNSLHTSMDPNSSVLNTIDNFCYQARSPMAYTPQPRDFWVTVFGFPPSAITEIIQHFGHCGIIVDKKYPPETGNWVHLRYMNRLECDRALSFNRKILGNNIMIGVFNCQDARVFEKENTMMELNTPARRLQPIAKTEYMHVHKKELLPETTDSPQRSSGLMNKALDLFFGW